MVIQKVYFNATDDVKLYGLLHKKQDKESKKVVLSVHGMTSCCEKKREDIFAEEFTNVGFDYFCFNNRGANVITYFKRVKNDRVISRIDAGTAMENFEDCYHDIKGAIVMLLEKGYETIYLQGHSYGAAKTVYTYNKLKENGETEILNRIKAVILLSIVDIPRMTRNMLGERFNPALEEIEKMVSDKKEFELIPREYFLHPMCAKNFLEFTKIGGIVDLVPFGEENPNLEKLQNIDCKMIMIWGKEKDLIFQEPHELEAIIRNNLNKENLEIKFIEGTGHNYHHKEIETVQEILKWDGAF